MKRPTLWSLKELIPIWSSLLKEISVELDQEIGGISIDTRTLEPGDLFFAVRGERTDGHMYIKQVLEKGATAAVVSDISTHHEDRRILQVTDVDEALRCLGKAGRNRSTAHIVGITGSVGKTGTKEVLTTLLSAVAPTFSNPGSFNNHWGTPLSLSRMPQNTRFGVFEMGMSAPGEIRSLTHQVRPHVALITCIASAHRAFFNSIDEIALAKSEIFEGLETGGTAILNHDDPLYPLMHQAAQRAGCHNHLSFGVHQDADIRLKDVEISAHGSNVSVEIAGQERSYHLSLLGRHWVQNSLGILAILHALDLELEPLLPFFSSLSPYDKRGVQVHLPWQKGTLTLIDESYNANPASMKAALAVLGTLEPHNGGKRVAVLGDMGELGEDFEIQAHQDLAPLFETYNIPCAFLYGPLMKHLYDTLPPTIESMHFENYHQLEKALCSRLGAHDIVMIKGSRFTKLERILTYLKQQSS